jgi:hypothetical protein
LTNDVANDVNGKQWAVTALGGTQTGVVVSSVSSPFTVTFYRPKVLKTLGNPDPITGVVRSVPRNTFTVIVRKAVTPLAGQPTTNMVLKCTMDVPAGADTADPASIRAGLSLLIGAMSQVSAGLGDTVVSGILG